jgi:hypothetical protein
MSVPCAVYVSIRKHIRLGNELVSSIALLTCILEVSGSNLSFDISYIDWGFRGFLLTFQEQIWNINHASIWRYAAWATESFVKTVNIYGSMWQRPLKNDIDSKLQTVYEDTVIITLIRTRRLNWIGHIRWLNDTRKVEHMCCSQPEGVRRTGRPRSRWWNVFGQIWRQEELRIGDKYVGIAKNGRRPSRRRRSTWDFRSTKKKKYGSKFMCKQGLSSVFSISYRILFHRE